MAFAKPIISNLDQIGEIFESKIYANELDDFKNIKNESAIVYEPDNYDDLDSLGQNAYNMVIGDVNVNKIGEF